MFYRTCDVFFFENRKNYPTNSRVEVNVAEGQLARLEVPQLVALDADVDAVLRYQIADADLFNLEVADGRAFLSLKSSLGLSNKSSENHSKIIQNLPFTLTR